MSNKNLLRSVPQLNQKELMYLQKYCS